MGRGVLQPIVTAQSAAELQPQLARGDVELVMDDEDFSGLDAVETRQRAHCLTRAVHEGLWHQQPDASLACIGDQTVKAGFVREAHAELIGEPLTKPKPGVVPGFGVFGPRIAEADDETQGARRRRGHRCSVQGIRMGSGRCVAYASSPSSSVSAAAPRTFSAVATTASPSPRTTSSTPAGSVSSETCTE